MFYTGKIVPIALAAAIAAPAGAAYPPLEVLRLAEAALGQNPGLRAARLEAEEIHAAGKREAAWEPSEIDVDFYHAPYASFPNPLLNQHEIDYSISQTIPFPGKSSAQAAPLRFQGEASGRRAESEALSLRREVFETWTELWLAQQRRALNLRDQADLKKFSAAARVGYENGNGTQADLLRAESEGARLENEALEWTRMAGEAQARLAALVNRPGETVAQALDSLLPIPISGSADSRRLAIDKHPELDAARLESLAAEAEIQAARETAYPDFVLRGMWKYMPQDPNGYWSVMAGVKAPILPWSWARPLQGVRAGRAGKEKAEREIASTRNRLGSEAERAAGRANAAYERFQLSRRKQIPLADQTVQAAFLAYQGGKAPFGEVIAALREARVAREASFAACADHLRAWAELERALGGTIPGPTGNGGGL